MAATVGAAVGAAVGTIVGAWVEGALVDELASLPFKQQVPSWVFCGH